MAQEEMASVGVVSTAGAQGLAAVMAEQTAEATQAEEKPEVV